MPSVPPLWEGYDDKSEDDLLSMLEAKVDATLDPADPTDERATRDFAQALASHEWLKREAGDDSHHAEVFAYARRIVTTEEAGSWRPR
jgi:hypothetical protein